MSIQFPLLMPAVPGFQSATPRMQNIVGVNSSPFTGQQQAYEFPGEWWECDLVLPPIVDRATAEQWLVFLASLRGQSGTFLHGDPVGKIPMGSGYGSPLIPKSTSGSPLTALPGSAAMSKTLALCGFRPNDIQILRAGDYLEIGRNFLTSPSHFTDAAWQKAGSHVPVASASVVGTPDAAEAADQIVFGASGLFQSNITQFVQPPPILATGQVFTFGVWLRSASASTVTLKIFQTVGAGPIWTSLLLASQDFNITSDWGFFPLSGAMLTETSGASAAVWAGIWGTSVTVNAWGASLDDGRSRHRLHKVLNDVDSDENGKALIDIFPRLREIPDEAATINMQAARGQFRLAENQRQWTVDAARTYGISFKAVEAF